MKLSVEIVGDAQLRTRSIFLELGQFEFQGSCRVEIVRRKLFQLDRRVIQVSPSVQRATQSKSSSSTGA